MKKLILIVSLLLAVNAFALEKSKDQTVNLEVTEKGFQPKSLDVQPDKTTVLMITRKTDSTCAKQIQIPSKNIKKDLPLNQAVSINIGKLKKGEIRFGCGINMMDSGVIHVK